MGELLGPLAPRLADPRGGAVDLHLDSSLRRSLADPLDGTTHAIRPPLGIGSLQQFGNPWTRVRADWWLAGTVQLQLEVEPGALGRLGWGFPSWLAGRLTSRH